MRLSLLFCSILICLHSVSQPSSGLIAHYTFSGNAYDVSGNGNNGIVHGATLSTDQYGNPNSAYSFNGVNDYIELPVDSFLLNNYSYSVCLKATAYPLTGLIRVFFGVGNNTADNHLGIGNTIPNPLGFGAGSYYAVGQAPNVAMAGVLPNLNSYYHVISTRDNNTLKLYVNGALITTSIVGGPNPSYGNGFKRTTIGCRSELASFFQGIIDDVAIYNRALSANEIQNYQCNCSLTVLHTQDTSICVGTSANLHVSGASVYHWSPSNNLDTIAGSNVHASPDSTRIYTVTSTDTITSCSTTSEIVVTVNQLPVQPVIFSNGTHLASSTINGGTYQWNYFGVPIGGASSQFFTADTSGYYTVTVTSHSTGCSSTSDPVYVSVTGTEDIYPENSLKIYPNPARDEISLEFNLHYLSKQISISIFNTLGQSITSELILNSQPGIFKKLFSIPNLPDGIYRLRIDFDNAATINKKFVVQK